jgi:hypothetical protein
LMLSAQPGISIWQGWNQRGKEDCCLQKDPGLALFRYTLNSKFYTLSVTSNFEHMHGALNIDKKTTNCTVWL